MTKEEALFEEVSNLITEIRQHQKDINILLNIIESILEKQTHGTSY